MSNAFFKCRNTPIIRSPESKDDVIFSTSVIMALPEPILIFIYICFIFIH